MFLWNQIANLRNAVILGAFVLIAALGLFLRDNLWVFLVLAVVILAAVACVLWWMIQREAKAKKAGRELESVFDRQVEAEIQRSTFGQQTEVRNLKAEWDKAIQEFKRSPAGRRLGDKALAELPMYLVIGPPGAGKTTFIGESGLESVLRDSGSKRARAVRGVGGGRSFDWWFTEQAILLDMAGKALKTSQFDDTDDWIAFLTSLRKLRPERPINGVVFTVPVGQVAGADKAQMEPLATALRERARDLGHHLGMEFPVYVVLTHADAIAGFAEVFAAFTPDQAAQPWGMTLSRAKSRDTAADALFDAEWTSLVAALGSLRTDRLTRLPDETQRMRALALPAQLERLRGDLKQFVHLLFARGKGREDGAFLRGLYLTSSKVGDGTIDYVLGSAARAANVEPHVEAPTMEVARHSWFSQQLWRRIIFKDALLASANDYAIRAQRRQWLVLAGGSGLAFVLFTTLFGAFAWDGARPLRAMAEAASALGGVSSYKAPREAWPYLERLRSGIVAMERARTHRSFSQRLGAYAGDGAIQAANDFYVRKAQHFLVDPVADAVEDSLASLTASGTARFADLFYLYRVYHLLRDEHARIQPQDSVVVGKVLVYMHAPELARVSPDSAMELRGVVRRQAQKLVLLGEPHRSGVMRQDVSDAALAQLRARWDEWPQLYQDMIADANEAVRPLTIKSVLEEAGRKQKLLRGEPSVPGAFTRAGWEGMVRPRLLVMEFMVQPQQDPQLAELGAQVSQLTRQMLATYSNEYVAHWSTFLGGIKSVIEPTPQAAMRREAGGGSEIEAMVRRVDREGRLEGPPADVDSIPNRFMVVHRWLTRPRSDTFIGRVRNLVPFLVPDEDRSPMERFRGRLGKGAKKGLTGEPYQTAARSVYIFTSANTPHEFRFDEPLARSLYHLITVMYDPVGGGSSPALIDDGGAGGAAGPGGGGAGDPLAFVASWNADVVGGFTPIRDRYPVSPGGQDMSVDEFAKYFRPGGPLDTVYEKYFKSFMTRAGVVSGTPPAGITTEQVAWLRKALAVQDAMFGDGGAQPKLVFDVRTNVNRLAPSGTLFSVTWSVGGQEFTYDMSEETPTTLEWSQATSGSGSFVKAVLSSQPVDGPKSETEWGLFHVLDEANYTEGPNRDVIATWRFHGVKMAVQIHPKHVPHPFARHALELDPPPAAH